MTEPNGSETAYTYDALGRRTSASDGTLKTEYGYDAVGNLIRQSNEVVDLTYRYDLNGRMTEEARTEGGTTVRTGYKYDKAGQLTASRRSDGYAESFVYDPVGNMVEKTLNGTKIAMTYDAANELKTMEGPHGKLTCAYDLNGNLTQKTLGDRTDTYTYDARNHLKQYRGYDNYQVKYSYNALGMLHARESSGSHSRTTLEELIAGKEEGDDPDGDGETHRTTYVYDLTQPYYEVLTETTDGEVTSYTYGLERLAAYTDETRTAYLYDGRGSVIQTIGSLGTQTMAYSAYGELLTGKVSGYGYNGEYYDAATGMLNLRARQYEPAQARFSQRDSLKGSAASPCSLNAYLYCQNDAINFFDASGASRVAVNMTDGGGGRKSNSSLATLFQKAGQTIKNNVTTAVSKAVSSVAAVVKQVNEKVNPTTKSTGEAIVVSGSKRTSNFKYNFIESGIKGIKDLKAEGHTNITWIVFSHQYSKNDLRNFENTANSYGVNYVVVNNNEQFINYLNTGSIDESEGGRIVQITDLLIYGHGKPGVMMLGKADLKASYLEKQLNGAAFNHTKTVLYTCRAANPTKNDDTGVILAQTISDITQGETKAMNGKIDYAYIAYTKEEMNDKRGLTNELINTGLDYLSSVIASPPMPYGDYSYYAKYYQNEQALRERIWALLQLKFQDDEIEVSRKEFGYMQDGARYDPIPGKQAQPGSEEKRDPSYWETFMPGY